MISSASTHGATGLHDAVADGVEAVGVVGVGVDAEQAAIFEGLACVCWVQVEAVGLGVDLEDGAPLRCGAQYSVHIEIGAIAPADQPIGHVPDHVNMWVLDRVEHPPCKSIAVAADAGVHRGDDDVQLSQHLVRVVERAIRFDLDLCPLQHSEIIEFRVDVAMISYRCSISRSAVSPPVMARRRLCEWSVMTMYS